MANSGAGNPNAVQTRIKSVSAIKTGGQRKHDLRIGRQPNYVDADRADQNRVLIKSATGTEMRKICEDRRAQRDTKRAMKSTAAVSVSGIITFGHVAQTYFEELTNDEQDMAYLKVAEAIATRLNTSLHGLVHHGDEASPHAHFQLAAVNHEGIPVSQIAKSSVLKEIQTITAEVMAKYDPRIERGKSRSQKLAEGYDYADTVHKNASEMRAGLTEDLPALRAEIAEAENKRDEALAKAANHQRLAEKHRQTVTENADKAAKALKNLGVQEARAEKAQEDADSLTETIRGLRSTVTRLEAREIDLRASVRCEEAELKAVSEAVAQKKTKIENLEDKKASLLEKLRSLNAA